MSHIPLTNNHQKFLKASFLTFVKYSPRPLIHTPSERRESAMQIGILERLNAINTIQVQNPYRGDQRGAEVG